MRLIYGTDCSSRGACHRVEIRSKFGSVLRAHLKAIVGYSPQPPSRKYVPPFLVRRGLIMTHRSRCVHNPLTSVIHSSLRISLFFRLLCLHFHGFEWQVTSSPAESSPNHHFLFHNSIFADNFLRSSLLSSKFGHFYCQHHPSRRSPKKHLPCLPQNLRSCCSRRTLC